MKKKYISQLKNIGLGVAMLTATSCAGDYLDTTPTSSIGTSSVFETTDNAAMAVNGLAQILTTQQYYYVEQGQAYCGENAVKTIMSEYLAQDFVYNYMAPGWSPIMLGEYYNNAQNIYYNGYVWYLYYTLIGGANTIVAHIDEAEGTDEEKAFIKAQALTFRAYGYEQLMQFYTYRWQDTNNGTTDGVVLRLDESTGDMPLSSVIDCYDQIYEDCTEAIRLFQESGMDRAENEVWLPNENVAHAVYARAALNREDYSTALAQAKLAREGFPLMSNDEYLSGFCKPTSEWIMGSYADATENQWYMTFGTQFACNGYYANNTYYGQGAINKTLTDKMPTEDIRMKLFLTEDKFPGYDFSDPNIIDQTYAYFIDENLCKAAKEYSDSMTPSGLDAPYQSGYYYWGGHLKFWVFDTPGVSYMCQFRSSEMVLIEAEASYFLNDEDGVRNALIELNKTSGRNPNYTCTKSGDDLFEEIVDYRGLELWGEGFNWYDYKRWNRDIVRVGIKDGGNIHVAIAGTVEADGAANNKWTWDIPQVETDYNHGIK